MPGDPNDHLIPQLRSLGASMGRLRGVLTALCGIELTLLVWLKVHGSGEALSLVCFQLGVALTITTALWCVSQRQLRQWMERADAKLGPGSGRALVSLGSLPRQGGTALAQGMAESRQALRDAVPAASPDWVDSPAASAWAAAGVLALGAWCLPQAPLASFQALAALFAAWNAWTLGSGRKKA